MLLCQYRNRSKKEKKGQAPFVEYSAQMSQTEVMPSDLRSKGLVKQQRVVVQQEKH